MHALLAEIDHLAIGAQRRVLARQHGDRGRDDGQADARDMRAHPADQPAQHLRRLCAALAHVEMRIGAVADEGIEIIRGGIGDVGMQVEARDDGNGRPDDAAHHRQQRAFGVVVLRGEAGAVQHAIDAVELARRAQPVLPAPHHPGEEFMLHRPVRPGGGEQDRHRPPIAGRIHRGDESRQFAEHARRRLARLRQHRGAFVELAGAEHRLARRRSEAVAFDGEAEQRDTRCGHRSIPRSSAMRGVALSPEPVSTSTVVCSGVTVPAASSFSKAAETCAAVGST